MRSIVAASAFLLVACDSGQTGVAEAAQSEVQPDARQMCGADAPAEDVHIVPSVTLPNGRVVEVRIITARLDLATYPRPRASHWTLVPAFDAANAGYRYIRELTVTIDSGSQLLPVSAYGDLLFQPDLEMEVFETGPDVTLRLTGAGSSMGTWVASLRFEGRALVERYVTTSNFPDEAFERTEYGSPTGN